jgi:hypothetical protein
VAPGAKHKLELFISNRDKMAYLFLDKKAVFEGNFWDFHAGCYGPVIAGRDLSEKWERGMYGLVRALVNTIEEEGDTVTFSVKEITQRMSDRLMSGKTVYPSRSRLIRRA